jgi:hypothetical protein
VVDETMEAFPIKGYGTDRVCDDRPGLQDAVEGPSAPAKRESSFGLEPRATPWETQRGDKSDGPMRRRRPRPTVA